MVTQAQPKSPPKGPLGTVIGGQIVGGVGNAAGSVVGGVGNVAGAGANALKGAASKLKFW